MIALRVDEAIHQRPLDAVACCSLLLLLAASADVRSADDVVVFEGRSV